MHSARGKLPGARTPAKAVVVGAKIVVIKVRK
jgi:hypothetical protein